MGTAFRSVAVMSRPARQVVATPILTAGSGASQRHEAAVPPAVFKGISLVEQNGGAFAGQRTRAQLSPRDEKSLRPEPAKARSRAPAPPLALRSRAAPS